MIDDMAFKDSWRWGRLGAHAPRSYWYGWMVRGENKNAVKQVPAVSDPDASVLPPGPGKMDDKLWREMAESAWQVAFYEPMISFGQSQVNVNDVGLGDTTGVDERIADRLKESVKDRFPSNPEKWRFMEFERVRKDVLEKLKTFEVKKPLEEARQYVRDLLKGCPWSEDYRTDWEATVEATGGMDFPLEEHHVVDSVMPSPPPGPPTPGRGAFHVVVDFSGSMTAGTGASGMTRFDVASAIVWTFIQEAKAVNMQGLSHYMGIYGCDSFFCYPYPYSEYPAQLPLNPLPCGNILTVERDFLRYWPPGLGSVAGDNYWQLVLPIMYGDYVKFGGGDFILIIDGDLRRDTMFLRSPVSTLREASNDTTSWHNDASGFYEPEWQIELPRDPKNPSVLMKLQKYMVENKCGTGYVCWIIKGGKPRYVCPDCDAPWPEKVQFVEIDAGKEELVMECLNGRCGMARTGGRRLYRESYDAPCAAKAGCPISAHGLVSCMDCRYMYLVLGRMFDDGRHIFRGEDANEILTNIALTMTDQRTKRILQGRCNDVYLQDGEDPYNDLGPIETLEDELD